MANDDAEPRRRHPEKKNLDAMSVEALREYVLELKNEIDRVEAAIAAREVARRSAASFFKA